jgi:predicted nucleic acid-binding protein
MNGTDIFIDTNICIYLLNGDLVLAELLQDQNIYISIITEMELCAYHDDNTLSLQILNSFLESVSVVNIDEKVKINAIKIRKNARLKLPDSIIAASALTYKLPLLSADKGLKKVNNIDLVLYQKD